MMYKYSISFIDLHTVNIPPAAAIVYVVLAFSSLSVVSVLMSRNR